MYLFSRGIRLTPGNTRTALGWVQSITEKVQDVTSLPVQAYQSFGSHDGDRIVWSAQITDLADLERAQDKLFQDDGYVVSVDEGAQYVQRGTTDVLFQLLHGEFDGRQHEYMQTTQAIILPGALQTGLNVGMEIAQRSEQATGVPTIFATRETGQYGSVAWITQFTNVSELQKVQQQLQQDAKFLEYLDERTPGVFSDQFGSTPQDILRRIPSS